MKVRWAKAGASDLTRLYECLSPVNPQAAIRVVRALSAGAGKLADNPRLGERLDEFADREVRRILIGAYEMRYEIRGDAVIILRLWHTRENR